MQTIRHLITGLFLTLSVLTQAHPGGHGGGPQKIIHCDSAQNCTRAEAERAGAALMLLLTDEGQLEPSWNQDQRVGNAREVSVNEIQGWVIEYHNPAVTEKEKQSLYFVITKDGYVLGTTYDKSKFTEKNLYLPLIGFTLIVGLSLIVWFVFLRKPKNSLAT